MRNVVRQLRDAVTPTGARNNVTGRETGFWTPNADDDALSLAESDHSEDENLNGEFWQRQYKVVITNFQSFVYSNMFLKEI